MSQPTLYVYTGERELRQRQTRQGNVHLRIMTVNLAVYLSGIEVYYSALNQERPSVCEILFILDPSFSLMSYAQLSHDTKTVFFFSILWFFMLFFWHRGRFLWSVFVYFIF